MRGSRPFRARLPLRSLHRSLAAAAVAALCLTPLDASAQEAERSGVVQYFVDRGHDFLDIFRLRAGVPRHGEGYGAKARVTSLAQVGFVHYDGVYAGMERRGIGWTDERRTEGGISLAYASANEMLPRGGNQFLRGDTLWSDIENRRIVRNLPYWDDGRGHFLSLGGEVATPVLALDAGVYPSEALDFLTGFFTIDIFNDDELWMIESYVHTAPTTKPGPDLKAATARKRAEMEALYG
ncbi:hypothetical protein HZA57_06485, partial [Candidatus Poribacteria bacterium]|nr:hypothetical protein [Candidatus Poribacteria bacterium]